MPTPPLNDEAILAILALTGGWLIEIEPDDPDFVIPTEAECEAEDICLVTTQPGDMTLYHDDVNDSLIWRRGEIFLCHNLIAISSLGPPAVLLKYCTALYENHKHISVLCENHKHISVLCENHKHFLSSSSRAALYENHKHAVLRFALLQLNFGNDNGEA